jgi:transcriptional regulator with XRE-family HTH domain
MSLGAIQRAEKSYNQVSLGRLKQLAKALDVTLDELLIDELKY